MINRLQSDSCSYFLAPTLFTRKGNKKNFLNDNGRLGGVERSDSSLVHRDPSVQDIVDVGFREFLIAQPDPLTILVRF